MCRNQQIRQPFLPLALVLGKVSTEIKEMPALSAFIGCRAPSVRLDINSELYGGHGYSMALLQELPLFSVLMVEKSLPFSNLPFCLDRLRCSLWDCSGLGFNRFKAYQTNFLLFPVNAAIILWED